MLISSISEYQISNVQCFEYSISSQVYGECQIANVQYQKTSPDSHSDTSFWFGIFSCYIQQIQVSRYCPLTMHDIKAKYSMCLFHQISNVQCFEYPISSQLYVLNVQCFECPISNQLYGADNDVVMMGGLHILLNFMKAIGQHMENAGRDDIWLKSGAFAQNSISAMMEGKAYY